MDREDTFFENPALAASDFYQALTPASAAQLAGDLDPLDVAYDVVGRIIERLFTGVYFEANLRTVTFDDGVDRFEAEIAPWHDLLLSQVFNNATLVAPYQEDAFEGQFGRVDGVYCATIYGSVQLLEEIARPTLLDRIGSAVARFVEFWRTSL